ncbi:TPA: carboxymuconolactone decarboxylase family protein, partial [Staphylococcus aureus]|nr:carboxymuconolactone decarboxylase family protein [Staphylococcus aureus]MBK3313055.1 carboxymuconolactone decarboxylase family protein [Staphylococcus aureus]HAY2606819.1 carboxymuconolactone decarboxylase family protein [Staphylococcus aureus]HAZ5268549.1 carboxymuconolactone decarboxylase family protein [Staphylococcus aureus]
MPYNYKKQNGELMSVMSQGEKFIHQSPVNDELSALIKLLISKINGCHYCVDIHKKELKELGVTQMKIDEVLSFRHLDLFTDQEKVTLEFAEMLNSIKDFKKFEIIDRLKSFYDEEQIIDLVFVVNQINGWN